MQYAEVIIDHKAGYQPYTYAIPAAILGVIDVGSVVLVPFGRQSVHGVVSRFTRITKSEVKEKLRPIQSVVYEGKFIPEFLLQSCYSLQSTYGVGLSESLFSNLPTLPKRRQTITLPAIHSGQGFQTQELCLGVSDRIHYYVKAYGALLPQNKSVLVILPDATATKNLSLALQKQKIPCQTFPESSQLKQRREYVLQSMSNTKSIMYIGTRGVLQTALHSIGLVVIEDPWLPGHKDDNGAKLWSIMRANALCKARNIPLTVLSSLLWPDTQLIFRSEPKIIKSEYGTCQLIPHRSVAETLTSWIEQTTSSNRAIIIKEIPTTRMWCPHCRTIQSEKQTCPTCHSELVLLPKLTKDAVKTLIGNKPCIILSSEEIIQYTHYDSLLLLNFDAFLAVSDFRSSLYCATLLTIARSQTTNLSIATHQPDTWTKFIHFTPQTFLRHEIRLRQEHQLPPFSLLVHVSSPKKQILMDLTTSYQEVILKSRPIRRAKDGFQVSLLLPAYKPIPVTWMRTSTMKVDIMPLYIE